MDASGVDRIQESESFFKILESLFQLQAKKNSVGLRFNKGNFFLSHELNTWAHAAQENPDSLTTRSAFGVSGPPPRHGP